MISKQEYLKNRDKMFPEFWTPQLEENTEDLLQAINVIRAAFNKPLIVSSGYRPPPINSSTLNAAHKSNHMICLAIDLQDLNGELWTWCLSNLDLISKQGLFLEDRRWTPTWVHFQLLAPGSGNRIFVPEKGLPPHPSLWNGKYDKKFDIKPAKA